MVKPLRGFAVAAQPRTDDPGPLGNQTMDYEIARKCLVDALNEVHAQMKIEEDSFNMGRLAETFVAIQEAIYKLEHFQSNDGI